MCELRLKEDQFMGQKEESGCQGPAFQGVKSLKSREGLAFPVKQELVGMSSGSSVFLSCQVGWGWGVGI